MRHNEGLDEDRRAGTRSRCCGEQCRSRRPANSVGLGHAPHLGPQSAQDPDFISGRKLLRMSLAGHIYCSPVLMTMQSEPYYYSSIFIGWIT